MKTIKTGAAGKEVSLLQDKLKALGYTITDTAGTFGTSTHAAVCEFQRTNKLDADGIVDYRSWEAVLVTNRPATEKLTEDDFALVAALLDVEVAALKAVQKVETGGRGGFFAPGKPAILFEGHIFWSQLKKRGINPEAYVQGNENILYPKWEKGHYKGGLGEYDRLEQARRIHREAADASASWGMFQIMGFNFAACGEESVDSFVQTMCHSEFRQLVLLARFIKQAGILPSLQQKDWAEFAKRYNGPAYAQNQYDEKLKAAYKQFA